jgi:tellurite resistance-related uncharacterized protein
VVCENCDHRIYLKDIMSCEFKCDNCGKVEKGFPIDNQFNFRPPTSWFHNKTPTEDFEIVCTIKCGDELEVKQNNVES